MNCSISIKNLEKNLGTQEIFSGFCLDIEQGKITTIFGPNGSGKSTLLNIISGAIKCAPGVCEITGLEKYGLSYIFQNYRDSLLPWKNNYDNVALPLAVQHVSEKEIKRRVMELGEMFAVDFDWQGYPYQLSGGQQQILAFIRALITLPKILLIDEPFSALDYENNLSLREHLQDYYLRFKPTIVLVTHNIEEAVHMAHKIVIFSKKPTHVTSIIDNPIPFPRLIGTLLQPEFTRLKSLALEAFKQVTFA